MEKEKLKFTFYCAASCGGCEIAVLDIDEKILDVVALIDNARDSDKKFLTTLKG